MTREKRPTLADVANHAQVSTATVSRVLRNTGPVSQDLRQRIETSIAALGYTPRQSAPEQFGQGTIALLIGDLLNPFFLEIAQGVQDEANNQQMNLSLFYPLSPGFPAGFLGSHSAGSDHFDWDRQR